MLRVISLLPPLELGVTVCTLLCILASWRVRCILRPPGALLGAGAGERGMTRIVALAALDLRVLWGLWGLWWRLGLCWLWWLCRLCGTPGGAASWQANRKRGELRKDKDPTRQIVSKVVGVWGRILV